MRIVAIVVLGITILKLFLLDISNTSETGKIIALILLGILILTISFVYQKIKILVQDDNKKTKHLKLTKFLILSTHSTFAQQQITAPIGKVTQSSYRRFVIPADISSLR
ncbi:DUF2339 domain-containing protein [Flavobacterium sp. 7A]|uniref:DUF2339 domain-containing protein n=1 Tax=Flavobacterium sp. 7A TaxID=2940571 RepID=UPI002227B5C7|nr:DUF2339 domain-containing protein [Flavobacterium sp. 7A]MCW2121232.1 hypothetical protein [Flavobacterium sp. 7A]